MMVIATAIIVMESVAGLPAGGGGVSTSSMIPVKPVTFGTAWAGHVLVIIATTSRRTTADVVTGAELRIDAILHLDAHGDAIGFAIAESAVSGPRSEPSTNNARSDYCPASRVSPSTA